MKRMLSILTASVVILLFIQVKLDAQEGKNEKKIKIIIDDGAGKKVIIDTLLTDDSDIETIKTADGKIIWISRDNPDQKKDEKGSEHVTVTVTSDDKVQNREGDDNIAVWTETGDSSDVEKVIVVKKVHGADKNIEKSYDVMITTDDDSTVEKARYIIAKDGMVVTVEGEDEKKASGLMKVIEEYLGVNDNGEGKVVINETKKSSKK
jgi:peroxiredoxin